MVVRNMVCDRCVSAVRNILEGLRLPVRHIGLGEVELGAMPTEDQLRELQDGLQRQGFDLVEDRAAATIARIKAVVVRIVHHPGDASARVKLSTELGQALHADFSGLSALFSEVEGITIEHYFLLQRIERVKELVRYGEHTVSEIAFATGFSSAAHLSAQFKKLTGMTPTAFRKLGHPSRIPLDRVGMAKDRT